MGITIVGLGPGNGRFLTRIAWDVLSQAEVVYLRTERHPAVTALPASVMRRSFDHIYDTADSFESVYETIVAQLLELAQREPVIYAVPGHPFVGESTVTRLVAQAEAACPGSKSPRCRPSGCRTMPSPSAHCARARA